MRLVEVTFRSMSKVDNPYGLIFEFKCVGSPEGFIATVAELPSVSWIADTPEDAMRGVQSLVLEVLADMQANGESMPWQLPKAWQSKGG